MYKIRIGAVLFEWDEAKDRENRYILVGFTAVMALVVVCHCYRGSGDTIRLISARPATPRERNDYENFHET
jgi:uncharacterized protein